MWKTGHSLIKAKMRETEAELAGEMSGHFFFRERWYGFDDGLYAAARLLEILAAVPRRRRKYSTRCPRAFPRPSSRSTLSEGEQYAFIEKFRGRGEVRRRTHRHHRRHARGLAGRLGPGARVQHDARCWCCASTPKDSEALERIKGAFREQLLAVKPGMELPF